MNKKKCLVLVNGHYYYLWDLVNILSHVTQELSCNCSGCYVIMFLLILYRQRIIQLLVCCGYWDINADNLPDGLIKKKILIRIKHSSPLSAWVHITEVTWGKKHLERIRNVQFKFSEHNTSFLSPWEAMCLSLVISVVFSRGPWRTASYPSPSGQANSGWPQLQPRVLAITAPGSLHTK